jgi:DNA-binding NarL/FixJ family response regulator
MIAMWHRMMSPGLQDRGSSVSNMNHERSAYIMASKGTILAVTERSSIFGMLCAILSKDFEVACPEGPDADVDSVVELGAECVIVDLGISRADPIACIRDLNKADPPQRVIGLATANVQHLAEQAKTAGARDVLVVPDEIERLPSLIRTIR